MMPSVVHFDLQAHDIAAGGRADHAGADRFKVVFIESTDVVGIFVVTDYFIAVCHDVVSFNVLMV